MKKILTVLMMVFTMMVATTSVVFADTYTAMEKAEAKRDAAWDEWCNCKMMSLEEFTAEYKKNHFALSGYSKDWSASLSRAFKEYQAEVRQKQKELKAIYEEADAKYEEANQAWLDEMEAEMNAEADKVSVELDKALAELYEKVEEYEEK